MAVVPESKVLRHVDKRIHSDDWPIYHLRKVNVVSQQTQQCVSLLESHKDHAVQVTGVFEANDFSVGHEGVCMVPRCRVKQSKYPRQRTIEDRVPSTSKSTTLVSGRFLKRRISLSVCGLPEKLDGSNFTTLNPSIEISSRG